jgi:hypothetical protein
VISAVIGLAYLNWQSGRWRSPGFQVGSHEALPGSIVIASCKRLNGCDGPVGGVLDESRHDVEKAG